MATINISKLQRITSVKIDKVIIGLDTNIAVGRGEDLDTASVIDEVLYNWANETAEALRKSALDKKFNPRGSLVANPAEPHIVTKSETIKVLQLILPDSSYWAEHGRGATKKAGAVPLWKIIEPWITYRGINVHQVKNWKTKNKEGKVIKPYKNLSSTLEMRHVMAEAFAMAIHKRGTIKRFGYKGSKYLSSVINKDSLNDLSARLSEAVGYTIAVDIVDAF